MSEKSSLILFSGEAEVRSVKGRLLRIGPKSASRGRRRAMTPLFGNDFALRLDTFIGYKSKPTSLYQHPFVF